jgi:opacity protein-like surface antigen
MKTLIFAICAAALGTASQAQDFYAGATLDYLYPHSGDTQTVGSFIGGVELGSISAIDYGAELEFGGHLAGDADYDTQRFRLWGRYDLGNVAVRVAGGVTQFDFDNSNPEGYNLGVGVENEVSQRVTLRAEVIRDFMEDTFTAAVTTTRIGVIYNF